MNCRQCAPELSLGWRKQTGGHDDEQPDEGKQWRKRARDSESASASASDTARDKGEMADERKQAIAVML